MKLLIYRVVLVGIILLCSLFVYDVIAQCPMCKIAAESNLKDGGTAARGLNNGILYIFALPYLLIFTLGFLWYRHRKTSDDDDMFVHN